MSGFIVDPAGLAGVAPQYLDLADQLSRSRTNLVTALETLGNYWGDDEPGRQFAQHHVPSRDAAISYHGDLAEGLSGVGSGIAGWAGAFAATEQDVVDGL